MHRIHGFTHLWQLFGDASEYMVVEVPGLRQVFNVSRAHVLPAPVLSLHQVPAISLKHEVKQTRSVPVQWLIQLNDNDLPK